jgi:uncharacterized membrane protein YoaK (UPF0700 family)
MRPTDIDVRRSLLAAVRDPAIERNPMPAQYFRNLTGKHRSASANRQLGFTLAFVAGAANAGGFLAVRQYTSHMRAIAEQTALGDLPLALAGISSLASFLVGASCSAILVNWGRRRGLQSQFVLPLLVEAVLLLLFGLLGTHLALWEAFFVPVTVTLLCFIMGLQNATITKLSGAEIRTTHVTGIVTDLGIELGKLFYWNRTAIDVDAHAVIANRSKLRIHATMLASFFVGGLVGAIGFKHVGYVSTVPLAALLVMLAAMPVIDDLLAWLERRH